MNVRYLSALIAIPIFLGIFVFGTREIVVIALSIIAGAAAYEWGKLIGTDKKFSGIYSGGIFFGSLAVSWIFYDRMDPYLDYIPYTIISLALIFWIVCVPLLLKSVSRQKKFLSSKKQLKLIGLIILLSFVYSFLTVRNVFGGWGVCAVLALIWLEDGGAYIIGKKIGKTKFAPTISPNKTWQGFWGGLIVALIGGFIFMYYFYGKLPIWLMLIPIILSLIYAPLGDLFESLLKRHRGVKDSGNVMPGHGGVLDRIDSWLPTMTIWGFSLIAFHLYNTGF